MGICKNLIAISPSPLKEAQSLDSNYATLETSSNSSLTTSELPSQWIRFAFYLPVHPVLIDFPLPDNFQIFPKLVLLLSWTPALSNVFPCFLFFYWIALISAHLVYNLISWSWKEHRSHNGEFWTMDQITGPFRLCLFRKQLKSYKEYFQFKQISRK